MPKLLPIDPINTTALEAMGFGWHTDTDNQPYIADELVILSTHEADAYYEAANTLYDMYVQAAQYVIDNNLFFELGIPFNLIELVKKSWDNDVHWHLYGRFDLAGGIDGAPIKLIEFNADTPTALFESAIIQWALLRHNEMDESLQFNTIYETLRDNFRRLVTLFNDPDLFEHHYEGWKILFSAVAGNVEEEKTVRLLQQIASDAGFVNSYESMDQVRFRENTIMDRHETPYEYWFKLYPWEDIAIDEPELATLLHSIVDQQEAIILNPAYTLLFQSKGMLKILYDLFPDSPYLLPAAFEPLEGIKQVQKPFFGREGANVSIYDEHHQLLCSNEGPYTKVKSLYQAYTPLPKDTQGRTYQAGVFFAYEACGVGFRRGGEILDNGSKFVGHLIES